MRVAPLIVSLFVVATFAGCIGGDESGSDPNDELTEGITSVFDRHLLPFNVTDKWSHPLDEPLYDILDVLEIEVPVELPATEGGAGATMDGRIHMGVFLPDVPAGTKVPVIADMGPYYNDLDVPANERDSGRLGEFLIQNFVPQGYAVAQVSVFGTGYSNHCMDLTGRAEQMGVQAAVDALGKADWSNGNVGLIGRSYDGTTVWEAAMGGSPHLKTIVPISGLTGMHELMWRNGTAEFRGPIMHNVVYGFFGIDSASVDAFAPLFGEPTGVITPNEPDAEDAHNVCKDYLTGPLQGLGAYLTGDHFAPEVNDYWAERYYFDDALANYEGSVYYIHGLQDWNVDPHMAFPYYQHLIDAGIETKGLFGQWAHMYPDRAYEHLTLREGRGYEATPHSVRYDWAQDLLEWFDHYLMETGPKPALHAEVQDNQGTWRIEETYPPKDASWTIVDLAEDFELTDGDTRIDPGVAIISHPAINDDRAALTWTGFENDTRIAGMPRLHVTATPASANGQLFAELRDKTADLRLGHAVMDVRFADGGKEMQTVVPGQPLLLKMEFEAFDAVIPAGHELELVITQTGEDYLPSAALAPVTLDLDDSVLKLPVIERDGSTAFTPVAYEPCTLPVILERAENSDSWKRWLDDHCENGTYVGKA